MKNIIITGSNNKPVALDIFYNDDIMHAPVIVYAHGFNGFKDWGNFDMIAQQFVDAGFTFVKFNFSHNGTTPQHPQEFVDLEAYAENNYTKQLYDLDCVINWICNAGNGFAQFINTNKINLIGHSMGGGIAILKTFEDKRIKALITWASIAECKTPWTYWNKEKIIKWRDDGVVHITNSRTMQELPLNYQLYLDYIHNAKRLDIMEATTKIKVPFLICHGVLDKSVTLEQAYRLHNLCPQSQLFIIDDGDHVFNRKHPWTKAKQPAAMQQVIKENIRFLKRSINN